MHRERSVRRRLVVLLSVTVLFATLGPGAVAGDETTVATSDTVIVVALNPEPGGGGASLPLQVPPFSMIGAELPADDDVEVRVRADGGPWGRWIALESLGDDGSGPDAGSAEDGDGRWRGFSHPVWAGPASWVQARSSGHGNHVRLHLIDALGERSSGSSHIGLALRALLRPAAAEAATRPDMVTRKGWGADESWRRGRPTYTRAVRAGVLHHTAGSNDYSRAQAPAVVRGIYHYHTRVLGWSDIGYHFLVDRFGTVYEGRAGGVDRPVLGAHAGGFNTDTFGISLMGSFDDVTPSIEAQRAVAVVRAWKMAHHGVKPRGKVTLTSAGSSRYPAGRKVRLPTFFAHRDVSKTACPGATVYALMDTLRGQVSVPKQRPRRPAPRGPFPLFGDWTGDGIATPGWWRAGVVSIRLTNTSGPADHRFRFGRRGDVPVVGDFNGDGRDSVGVLRGRTWLLRNALSAGAPQVRFQFGRAGDWPIVGDWNGDGRDGIGVVSGTRWRLRQRPRQGPAQLVFRHGRITDWPVVGDWDGDGRATPGLVRGTRWRLRTHLARGASEPVVFGPRGARPVVGQVLPLGGANLVRVKGGTWQIRHRDGLLTQTVRFRR